MERQVEEEEEKVDEVGDLKPEDEEGEDEEIEKQLSELDRVMQQEDQV